MQESISCNNKCDDLDAPSTLLTIIIPICATGASALSLCVGVALGTLFGTKYSKKKFRIACQEQEYNESRQVPGPVYEEINLESTSGIIDLSKNLAYQCATNIDS